MKCFVTIIACAFTVLSLGALPASAQSERQFNQPITNAQHVGWKCKAQEEHVCPACHSHWLVDTYGKANWHGHYVHDCSGCGGKSVPGCAKNCGKKTG